MPTAALPELDAQYRQLREQAGLLTRESRRLLAVLGAEGGEYLEGQLTNAVEALAPGEGCYAALLDRKGHMQSDMRVLRLGADEIWIEVEAVALDAARKHLETYKVGREVEIADRSESLATVSLIGPAAAEVSSVGPLAPEYAHRELSVGSVACRAVATDMGIDLIAERSQLATLLSALTDAGAAEVSEDAAEIVRVESGRPRYGAEMGPATIPAEASIVERAVDFEKGCYIGQETVARLHYKGKPNRFLRGLRLSEPAQAGDPLQLGEREVGAIGTACVSPALGPIALAVVRREASPGDRVEVGQGAGRGEVVELPFTGV